jgi:hypothetical protein
MATDPLHDLFKKHLSLIDPETQGVEDLVYEVVGDYMAYLMKQGNIPSSQLDTLETDLKEEVLEIYRKVTYGYLNLKDYKSAQKIKGKIRSS